MKRVQVVVALAADGAQGGFQLVGRQQGGSGGSSQCQLHAIEGEIPTLAGNLRRASLSGSHTGLVLLI